MLQTPRHVHSRCIRTRFAMATLGDTSAGVEDYDTDTISLTSTVPEESGKYIVEDVLSEDIKEDGRWKYLIKWEGYGLHE